MFGGIFADFIIGCSVFLIAVYFYTSVKLSYWKGRNVPGPEPIPIFGNFVEQILQKVSVHEKGRDMYLDWKDEPFIGFYVFLSPILLINDPAIIRQIWIKDFHVFPHRGYTANEDVDPLSANLLELDDQRWRELRHKLTPFFTTSRLKKMYSSFNDCADVFGRHIEELVDKGGPVEVREISSKFTIDVISSCAFGLDINASSCKESEFSKVGQKWFAITYMRFYKHLVRHVFPRIFKLLKIRMVSEEDTRFFVNSIAEMIAQRRKNDVIRHDFIDLITKLQENQDGMDFELTDELVAAQALIFFAAGFETSSTTMSYALYEIALNQEIQDKLRSEIRAALKTNDGKLSYENIKELKYLDKVFKETLRKNPTVATISREAVEDYVIPGTDVEIPAGMKVFISVLGLHHDPQYYPNPEIFDPERFSEEAIRQRPQMVYLPFGEGPRNCIGARFADHQTKIGLIKILKNYRVTMCSKTEVPYRVTSYPIILTPRNGIYLNFEKIL